MSNLEHYFENLLYDGLDYEDEINKSQLTAEQIEAVYTCAAYITYTFFCGKDELKKYINGEIDVIKTGRWVMFDNKYFCSNCDEQHDYRTYYCPNCGSRMVE